MEDKVKSILGYIITDWMQKLKIDGKKIRGGSGFILEGFEVGNYVKELSNLSNDKVSIPELAKELGMKDFTKEESEIIDKHVMKLIKDKSISNDKGEVIAEGIVRRDLGKIGELSFLTLMSRIDKYMELFNEKNIKITITKGE